MTDNVRKILETISELFGRILVTVFGWSLCAMVLWNHVSYEFNLPTFSYWTFILLRLVIVYWHSNSKKD